MLIITIRSTPQTEMLLNTMPRRWSEALYRGVADSVNEIVILVKNSFGRIGNLKVISGGLRNSIDGNIQRRMNTIVGMITSDKEYAAVHEFGATIRAKSSEYLTFQIHGAWKKVKQVEIPARPFLRPGVLDNLQVISTLIQNTIKREVDRL